jgi:hypothetical protein
MRTSKNVDDLLAAIQRKTPTAQPEIRNQPKGGELAPTPPPVALVKRRRIGKPVQFWMHPEDLKILRELSAWLASQGVRASDSLVVRATLRTAKTGSELLQAFREAARLDGRLKSDRQPLGAQFEEGAQKGRAEFD